MANRNCRSFRGGAGHGVCRILLVFFLAACRRYSCQIRCAGSVAFACRYVQTKTDICALLACLCRIHVCVCGNFDGAVCARRDRAGRSAFVHSAGPSVGRIGSCLCGVGVRRVAVCKVCPNPQKTCGAAVRLPSDLAKKERFRAGICRYGESSERQSRARRGDCGTCRSAFIACGRIVFGVDAM